MSTNAKEVVPPITATSTVPELIKWMWLSFQPPDCSEVEAILINRENELKMEIEKLRNDNLRLKEEHYLIEKKHDLAELMKSKYESELLVSKKECHELNEKSAKYAQMLLEEEKNKHTIVLEIREKMEALETTKLVSEEKLKKLTNELKIVQEKHYIRMVVEKEKSRMVADLSGKVKVLEGIKLEMEEKTVKLIEELNDEKNMVEEKNQMLLVLEKDKSRIFSELSEKINGLESEKLKMQERFSKLIDKLYDEKKKAEEKVEKGEKERSIIYSDFNAKIQTLESEKLAIEEKLAKSIKELDDKKKEKHQILQVKEEKGIIAWKYSKKICDITEKIKGFDSIAFMGDANVAEKVKKSVDSRAQILIDLTESDDDFRTPCVTNNEQNACLKRKRSQVEGEGEDEDEVSVRVQKLQSLLSSDDGNISRANVCESIDSNKGKLPFIKQCNNKAEKEGNPASSNSFVSSDRENKWTYALDMLFSFTKDPQLCMNAVCTLYRQQFSAHKSIKKEGFSVRGTALAKFLINSDPENKLSRSVSEVREKCPKVLEECIRLAMDNYKQLFEIYSKKLDPYFSF